MKRLFLFLVFVGTTSCSIYKSADRNDFESESPAFKIKSFHKTVCSNETIANEASSSRLVTVLGDEFIWEHDVRNTMFFESTDLKGTYCFYDVKFE